MICVVLGMHKSGTTMIAQREINEISMGLIDALKFNNNVIGQQYGRLSTQELNMRN